MQNYFHFQGVKLVVQTQPVCAPGSFMPSKRILPKMFLRLQREGLPPTHPQHDPLPPSAFNQIPQPSHRMATAFQTAGNVSTVFHAFFSPCLLSQRLSVQNRWAQADCPCPACASLPPARLQKRITGLSGQSFVSPLPEQQVKV